ncbi:restriction endonuclease subunit S [Pseudomonas chlororaphis]|uniref:restriction endonuclease subunit S n=1 Tax=Pseudomonas chlororaphis TaxID=587753 RepID=UPI001B31978D|nr:restriction endonuclease subunit S [Pseudomonas chlororaphis]
MTTVGAVLKRIEAGRSTKTLERPAKDSELGILRVSAVTWGEFRPGENKAMPLDFDPGNVPRPMKGDILISRANTRELVGAPVMVEADHPNLLLSDKILRLVPDCNIVVPRYLLRALRSSIAASHFSQCAGGTSGSMTNITQGDIRATPLRLPPLPEQRRIAAILDKSDALRAKRREAIAKLDQLLKSVFLEMFGDTTVATTSVAELAPSAGAIRTGPFGSQLLHSEFVDHGIAVLGIDNAVSNAFAWAKPRFITAEKYSQLSRYRVNPGDVLITIMGTCGRCAVVPDDIPTAINTKHLCCISIDRTRCEPEFLHSYFLLHPVARNYLESRAKGAIMAGLNMGIIKELPVALPSIEKQRNFVSIKKSLGRQLEQALTQENRFNELFAGLQQHAFAGTL